LYLKPLFQAKMEAVNPYPRTWIEVDLPALGRNLSRIRGRIGPKAALLLVAKADAYGHGLVPIAKYAVRHGADWVGVATVQEGIALRDAGIQHPILILSPILEVEADQAVFYGLRVMVERFELGVALSKAAASQGKTAIVHLPVDTGLSRYGCTPKEAAALEPKLRALGSLELEGIGTHFADSGFDAEGTERQLATFDELVASLAPRPKVVHAANSAAATKMPEATKDLVRVGIAAYGIDPYGMFDGELEPILTWKARVMSLRERPAGTKVSYSGTYTCERPTKIATLGVGYGDGYPRSLSSAGFVELCGQRVDVIGLVCMDQILIDVTDTTGVEIGDEVKLIGGQATVVELSRIANTNVHEIVTRIMSRVPRRYKFDA
jgi:alanine racemase